MECFGGGFRLMAGFGTYRSSPTSPAVRLMRTAGFGRYTRWPLTKPGIRLMNCTNSANPCSCRARWSRPAERNAKFAAVQPDSAKKTSWSSWNGSKPSTLKNSGCSLATRNKEHLAKIHTLPCIVCLNCYGRSVQAEEAHHLESVRGEHSDFATVPLCRVCHKELHARRRRPFYVAHKLDDVKMLAWTIELLEAT